jgi:hypothetical protein
LLFPSLVLGFSILQLYSSIFWRLEFDVPLLFFFLLIQFFISIQQYLSPNHLLFLNLNILINRCTFLRLIAQGRLSEVIGSSEEAEGVDIFFRKMGFARDAEEEEKKLHSDVRRRGGCCKEKIKLFPSGGVCLCRRGRYQSSWHNVLKVFFSCFFFFSQDLSLLSSYCDGFNEVMSTKRRPPEWILLGVHPEPWRPRDTLVTTKVRIIKIVDAFHPEKMTRRSDQETNCTESIHFILCYIFICVPE